MAVKEFNCNKLKRTFWPFTLKDKTDKDGNVVEKGKKIIVRMPQKQVFEAIKEILNEDLFKCIYDEIPKNLLEDDV